MAKAHARIRMEKSRRWSSYVNYRSLTQRIYTVSDLDNKSYGVI